jgi:hypothetical protein
MALMCLLLLLVVLLLFDQQRTAALQLPRLVGRHVAAVLQC